MLSLTLLEAPLSSRDAVIPFPGRSSHTVPVSHGSHSSRLGHSVSPHRSEPIVSFQRPELNLILSRYGMMVAKGEWRDYALDMGRDVAVFSIFRHTSERPLYRVEKHPKLSKKQGAYIVRNAEGSILKRGHDLSVVLKYFDKQLRVID